jgi:hypothetical protein
MAAEFFEKVYNLSLASERAEESVKTVYAPGVTEGRETNEFFNVVHVLAVHGWSIGDSEAVEVSTRFSEDGKSSSLVL